MSNETVTMEVSVSIGLAGCRMKQTLDFDKEDWDEMTDHDKEEAAGEVMFEMIEWNWREK